MLENRRNRPMIEVIDDSRAFAPTLMEGGLLDLNGPEHVEDSVALPTDLPELMLLDVPTEAPPLTLVLTDRRSPSRNPWKFNETPIYSGEKVG